MRHIQIENSCTSLLEASKERSTRKLFDFYCMGLAVSLGLKFTLYCVRCKTDLAGTLLGCLLKVLPSFLLALRRFLRSFGGTELGGTFNGFN